MNWLCFAERWENASRIESSGGVVLFPVLVVRWGRETRDGWARSLPEGLWALPNAADT